MTIAERAEEYAWKEWPNPMFAIEWEDCKSDYIKGATEQKAEDEAGLPRWKRCGDELPEPLRDVLLKAHGDVGSAWLTKHNWDGHEVVEFWYNDDISFEPRDEFEWVYMEDVTKMIREAEDEK